MEMEEDRKVVVLVISNIEKNVELFRVHIHEQSIRFDSHFTEGIQGNPDLSIDVEELNNLWKEHKIATDQIFPIMLHFMNKYGDYLRNYYFKEYELDKDGKYIEPPLQDKASLHYQYLKQSKKLKKISKKEFEQNLQNTNPEVTDFYVDNYVRKGAKFYKSEKIDPVGKRTVWFFMVVNERFKISFSVDFEIMKIQ